MFRVTSHCELVLLLRPRASTGLEALVICIIKIIVYRTNQHKNFKQNHSWQPHRRPSNRTLHMQMLHPSDISSAYGPSVTDRHKYGVQLTVVQVVVSGGKFYLACFRTETSFINVKCHS